MARQKRYPTAHQVGRAGELFVAAELNRRGAFATLYLTNTPRVDVVATSPDGRRTAHIQVKTKGPRSSMWQWDIRKAVEETQAPTDYFMVLVDLVPSQPDYYIVPLRDVAIQCYEHRKVWLKERGGERPRTPGSTHLAIRQAWIEAGKDDWHVLGVLPERH